MRGATVLFALGVATLLSSFSDNVSLAAHHRFLRSMSASNDQPLLKYYHIAGTSMGDQMFAWSSIQLSFENFTIIRSNCISTGS